MKKLTALIILILAMSILLYGCDQKQNSYVNVPKEETGQEEQGSAEIGEEYEKPSAETGSSTQETKEEPQVREIIVEATQFKFTPDPIKVKFGEKIRINFNTLDVTHGFNLPDFGINIKGSGTADFVADKRGTFTFRCSVFCGAGHSSMTGTLIVE